MHSFAFKFGGISNSATREEQFQLWLVVEGYIHSCSYFKTFFFFTVLLRSSRLEHRNTAHGLCFEDFSKPEPMSFLLGFVFGLFLLLSADWSLRHF